MNAILDFEHIALAELIWRRWQEGGPYLTLKRTACGAWVEGSSGRQPANSALKLHRSRRSPAPPERPLRFWLSLQEIAVGRANGSPGSSVRASC